MKYTLYAAALSLFFHISSLSALPLTYGVRALPDGAIQFGTSQTIITAEKSYVSADVYAGASITEKCSAYYTFSYIERAQPNGYTGVGDSKASISYFAGHSAGGTFLYAFFAEFRIPSVDPYSRRDYDAFRGFSEASGGISVRLNIGSTALHSSISWIFRQAEDETFYATSFFSGRRLKNDGATLTFGANSMLVFPFVPYIDTKYEMLMPFRDISEDIGSGAEYFHTFTASAGTRFFFNEDFSLYLSYSRNVYAKKHSLHYKLTLGGDVIF
jgi:hypothetical protein